jgi:hypothetical protein
MSCRTVIFCAAALVCVAAGCVNNSFLAPGHSVQKERWLVNEPFTTSAAVLETGLRDACVKNTLLSKRVQGEVRIAGQTKSGKVFCLYVRPAKNDLEKAVVTLRWDREADPVFRKCVLDLLTPPAKDDEESTTRPAE